MTCCIVLYARWTSSTRKGRLASSKLQAFQPSPYPPTHNRTVVLLPSKTTARTHASKICAGAVSSTGLVGASLAPTTLHSVSVTPVLRRSRRRTEPPLHDLRCEDVVLASTECRPDACEEVVQVCGDQTEDLGQRGVLTVDDEGHEQQSEWQELGVKIYDEEVDLTRGVVLGERVRVCEREGGEERVTVEKHTCGRLSSPSATLLSRKRAHIA